MRCAVHFGVKKGGYICLTVSRGSICLSVCLSVHRLECSLAEIVTIDLVHGLLVWFRSAFQFIILSPRPHRSIDRPINQSSVNRASNRILKIIINNPIVTIISNANPNHPNIIAVVPTPLFTLPFPRSCAIVLAATDAVCCHKTLTSTKTAATKIRARATWETAREGKGLMSRSEPSASTSSCQPGKVARMMKQAKARTMATMLS